MKALLPLLLLPLSLLPGLASAGNGTLATCRAISDPAARLACYDALAADTPGTDNAPGRARETAAQFGARNLPQQDRLEAIESTIPGHFDGWEADQRIQLANGQVWKISDDSRRMLDADNPKVRIRRGALGAFYLEVEGTNMSPRVTRVK